MLIIIRGISKQLISKTIIVKIFYIINKANSIRVATPSLPADIYQRVNAICGIVLFL